MRLYVDLNSKSLLQQIGFTQALTGLSVKRGDTCSFELQFVQGSTIVELDPGQTPAITLKFGAKISGQYDGNYVVSNWDGATFAYTKTGGSIFSDASITAASPVLASATAGFTSADIGRSVTGAGIPAGVTIISYQSATQVTLSANATATAAGVTIVISGRTASYVITPSFNTTKLNNLHGYDPFGFAEVTDVTTIADVAGSLAGKYFDLHDVAGAVRTWFKVSGAGVAPVGEGDGRLVEVDIVTNDTATAIATAIAAAFAADAALEVIPVDDMVEVIDRAVGPRTAAVDGNTGFEITREIAGSAPLTIADVPQVSLMAEIEWTLGDTVTSTDNFTLTSNNDVNRGNEGVPTNATPAYPLPGDLELIARKDVSNGYTGLTLLKINFWNAARTFLSFFTNANTAARTYTFPDRTGTIADDTDITSAKARANHTGTQSADTLTDGATNRLLKRWIIRTAFAGDYNATSGDRVMTDTSGGGVGVILPAAPAVGDEVIIADGAMSWGSSNAVFINRNGQKINGGEDDYTGEVDGGLLHCVYVSAGYGWRIAL